MNILYDILIFIASIILKIAAWFNPKMKLFVNGRKETFDKLSKLKKEDNVIWFHTASLGEFEQGRSIIEKVKFQHPNYKIVVTFFSPSGYEIQKNYNLADVVCYLPFDSKRNVKKFINIVHPNLAVFIKYEFWPNLLNELKRTHTNTILVSGMFRNKQPFFKFYGGWMRNKLNAFHYFFVQDENSKMLLKSVNFNNVVVSGDTRFDRVSEILQQDNSLDFISAFKDKKHTVVAGSTWKEDEKLLVNYINNKALEDEKFIIAPHTINQKRISELRKSILKKTILYSEKNDVNLKEYQVFIIDTVGILTKIYSYANVAYIGGGFKTGLHNILEPATFGIPVIFGGAEFQKFKEAIDLIQLKGCINIQNEEEVSSIFAKLKTDKIFRNKTGNINKKYIQENIGATRLVLQYINNNLN